MKIAVTDACIFIDLIELRLLVQFFSLDLEIHTSIDVFNELDSDQQELLKDYISVNKLFVHNISSSEWNEIFKMNLPNSLTNSDKSVIFLSKKLSATVISSDKKVRYHSKQNAIPYHGILWIFDELVKYNLITKPGATVKIKLLVKQNLFYQNNAELASEIEKRILLWND